MARNQYRIAWENEINERYYLFITPDDGILNTIDLVARRNTVILSSSFNDDSKIFAGIISKELSFDFQFDVDIRTELETFFDNSFGLDFTDWKVVLYRNDETRPFFQGYLSLESNSQPLFNRRDRVSLRATDGLSALKGIDFTDTDGTNFDGKHTPLFFITQALGRLGTDIKLRTVFNMTHVLMDPLINPLDQVNIESKLFGEGEVSDAYEAINLICANFKCRVYQESGYWWIDSLVDRMQADYFNYYEYSITAPVAGVYGYTLLDSGVLYFTQDIGHNKDVKLTGGDGIKYIQMPKKLVELTFNYKIPAKPFCNSDFSEKGAAIPYALAPVGGAYVVDCWLHQIPPYATPGAPVNYAFISDNLDDAGDVVDQSLYVESESGGIVFMRSPLFEIGAGDIIDASVSIQARVDTGNETGTVTVQILQVVLVGDDGSYWTLDNDGRWYLSNASLSVNSKSIGHQYIAGDNDTNLITVSVTSDRVPRTGRIEILLLNPFPFISGSPPIPQAAIFKDVTIERQPRQGGKELKGDINSITQTFKQQGEVKETVEISDLPVGKRYIAGGLYKLAPNDREEYYPQWDFMGAFTAKKRFTHYIAEVLARYTNKPRVRIEGGLKRYITLINDETLTLGFLPRYRFTDYHPDKEFMLTGQYSLDLTSGIWRGVFVELKEAVTLIPAANGEYEFEYITE